MARVLRLGRRGREFESHHPDKKMKDVRLISYQKKFNYSYSLGVFPTIELMENRPEKVIKIIFHPKGKENKGVKKLISFATSKGVRTEWSEGLIKKIGGNDNTYAVGVFNKYQEEVEPRVNHLVLANPEDGGNLGTMIRTALAFGIKDIAVIRPAVDIFDPKVVRASMGSIFKVNIEYFDDFTAYKTKHLNHCYLFMTDGEKMLKDVLFSQPYSLVFGGESSGLSKEYRKYGETVTIPQSKSVDSLNLSIAAGIAMYSASVR